MRERIKAEACRAAISAILCPTTVRHYLSVKEACFRLREENDYEGGVGWAAALRLEPRSRQFSPEPNRLQPKPGVKMVSEAGWGLTAGRGTEPEGPTRAFLSVPLRGLQDGSEEKIAGRLNELATGEYFCGISNEELMQLFF